MTKTLITVSFAVDLDEDALAPFAAMIEEGMRNGLLHSLAEQDINPEDLAKVEDLIDFYGATISLRRSMSELAE